MDETSYIYKAQQLHIITIISSKLSPSFNQGLYATNRFYFEQLRDEILDMACCLEKEYFVIMEFLVIFSYLNRITTVEH